MTYNDLPLPKPLPRGWWRESCLASWPAGDRTILVQFYGINRADLKDSKYFAATVRRHERLFR